MEAAKLAELKEFITKCKSNPSILHDPSIAFFKSYIQSLGARIPPIPKTEKMDDDMSDTKEHFDAKRPVLRYNLCAGEVIGIHSARELETKLNVASKTSRLAILYFTATWCGPCRLISPLYTSLAGKYKKVVFLKIDIDEARDAAANWNISSVPAFFFVRNGKEVDKMVGADKAALERKIAQHAG